MDVDTLLSILSDLKLISTDWLNDVREVSLVEVLKWFDFLRGCKISEEHSRSHKVNNWWREK